VKNALEKLAAAGIQIAPAATDSHFVLERDGFIALVERHDDKFGNVGAPMLLTERGFAALVWREGRALFVAKGFEQIASERQVRQLRTFASDLQNALASSSEADADVRPSP